MPAALEPRRPETTPRAEEDPNTLCVCGHPLHMHSGNGMCRVNCTCNGFKSRTYLPWRHT